jgi:hypothetical protein
LERVVAGIDGNRGRLLGNGSLESRLRTRRDISVSRDGSTNIGRVVSALSLDSLIRVRSLGVNSSVADDVFESIIHQSTITSVVSERGRAIEQLLLGERDKVSGGDLVDTLGGSSGGESPASSALSLVLDSSDSTLSGPVNRGRGISGLGLEGGRGLGDGGSEVHSSVLLVAHISHDIKAKFGLRVGSIPGVNIVHVVLENSISGLELSSSVELLERLHPIGEFILVFLFSEARCNCN